MSWQRHLISAENLLLSQRIPSSTEIITLIKKVNPTSLNLSESDKAIGYDLKGRLQNLLLENYGASFHLTPHPYDPEIILIKHHLLPSVDACHADLKRLSVKAQDEVATPLSDVGEKSPARNAKKHKSRGEAPQKSYTPKERLRMAGQLLEKYEYEEAEDLLAGIRVKGTSEVPVLIKACRVMLEEMGAYDSAIKTLLSQPAPVLREEKVREVLALSYYHNGMLLEARAIFELCAAADLDKEALHAYADLSLKDGNLLLAWQLLKTADHRPGFLTAFVGLRKEVEQRMLAEADPTFQRAAEAFEANELEQAAAFAREALEYYPFHQSARALVLRIDELNTAAETAKLWERFESCEQSEQRLDLLGKLSELDKGNKEKVRNLFALEKKRQKRESVESRLSMLSSLAEKGDWSACFDIVQELSRLEENEEQFRRVLAVSQLFAPLCANPRLERLPEPKVKEMWLTFVRVKQAMLAGRYDGCLESMERIKAYFRTCPHFKEDYRTLREFEQGKARSKVGDLLARMREPDCSLAEAQKTAAALRGPISALPTEERARCERELEELLRRHEPATTKDPLWENYEKALLTGNQSKTDSLKDLFDDHEARERIEAGIRNKFAVGRQPIALSVSDELTVDFVGQSSPLTKCGATERYVFLRESDHAVIFVDLFEMVAVRLTSTCFENLHLYDSIPERGIFLFIDRKNRDKVWRMVVTEAECRFTAVVDLINDFSLQGEGHIHAIYLSSEDSSEYFATIDHDDAKQSARMVKQHLSQKFHAKQRHKIKGQFAGTYRLSSTPDRFIIGAKFTSIVDENLVALKETGLKPELVGIDRIENTIYAIHEMRLVMCDPQLNMLKDFPAAIIASMFDIRVIHSVCKSADMVMIRTDDEVATLYDLQTNKFVVNINSRNLLFGTVCDKWFYYTYDESTSTLKLKDISRDLDTLFEWEEMFRFDMDYDTMYENWGRITGNYTYDEKAKGIWTKFVERRSKSGGTAEVALDTIESFESDQGE